MTSTLLTLAQSTGTCPKCQGNWETCTCTGVAPLAPRAYERDETEIAHQRLGSLLARIVTETDARIPAVRRAPRTVAEMRARINIAAGRACSSCGGQGGQVVDTSSGGVTRRNWQSCGDCGGTGEAR